MPTPIEIFVSPVALICLAIYGALMLWEYLLPARKLPAVPYWQLRGLRNPQLKDGQRIVEVTVPGNGRREVDWEVRPAGEA